MTVDPLLHVPGVFRCAVCGFTLMQSSLRAIDGAVGVRDDPGEQCPNDGHLLGRMTWRQQAQEWHERATEYLERAVAAETELRELKARPSNDQ